MGIYTGRMRRLQHPVAISGIGDCLPMPFYKEVARGFLEEGRAREGVDVEFGFGRHGCGCLEGWRLWRIEMVENVISLETGYRREASRPNKVRGLSLSAVKSIYRYYVWLGKKHVSHTFP